MLREWNGDSNQPLIDIAKQFGLDVADLKLLKYEILSPDSFIWFFTAKGHYCLYAEDFVHSLDLVSKTIHDNLPSESWDDKFELLQVKSPQKWEEASPVTSADTYEPPKDKDEFMKYAGTSGYDFVFLAESKYN